jgi:hypothetical protein
MFFKIAETSPRETGGDLAIGRHDQDPALENSVCQAYRPRIGTPLSH